MTEKVFTKSIRYLVISTLLIMAFTRGDLCDWLLIGNGAAWVIVEAILLTKAFERRKEESQAEDVPKSDETEPPEEDVPSWYRTLGRGVITSLITELNVKGIWRLVINESGEIRLSKTETEKIEAFPRKTAWDTLISELADDGLDAHIENEHLVIQW